MLSQRQRNGKEEEGVSELRSAGMKMLTWTARRGGKKRRKPAAAEQPACDQHLNHS